MRILTHIVRAFVGILFIISGLVKTVDPIGFSYKLEEYFSPQVFDIPFLMDWALPLSTFFVIFEVMLGVLLLLGVWRNFTLLSLLGLIVFFSFLTFYSAYFNKVTDCGCFGDALKLEPWQSFYKDLVLLVLSVFLWWNRKYVKRFIAQPYSYIFGGIALIACIYIAYEGIYRLPLKDFRPYAIGKNISEGMKSAEELGEKPTIMVLEYQLQNKLNNKIIKVDENEYINNKKYWEEGSSWELIGTDNKIVQKGYEPPIHDFTIDCGEKGDLTNYYLSQPKVLLIVNSIASKSSELGNKKIEDLVLKLKAQNTNIDFVNVASQEVKIADLPTCFMDATTLKTMIRSNPGIILLKKGTIINKYAWRALPSADQIIKDFE